MAFVHKYLTFLYISYLRLNEWRFGESRDDCTVYTFLHNTFHMELVYEKYNGKISLVMVFNRPQEVNEQFFLTIDLLVRWWAAVIKHFFFYLRCEKMNKRYYCQKAENLNHVALLATLMLELASLQLKPLFTSQIMQCVLGRLDVLGCCCF